MAECFKCGKESSESSLFNAISKEGIVKMCQDCFQGEDIPIVKKPTTVQLREAEQPSSVYERLSSIAGVNAQEHFKKFRGTELKKKEVLKEEEITLKELVDKNYKERFRPAQTSDADLIPNFHWIIMRGRRMKKLTQVQLAREIGESKAAIEMAERGNLPEDWVNLAKKLERILGIRIIKSEPKQENLTRLDVKSPDSKELTISDLREMKKETEEKVIGKDIEIEEDIIFKEEIEKKDL